MRTLLLLVLTASLLGCQSAPRQVPRSWQLPDGAKAASVNGYDLAYVEKGAGVPVVFVHGGGVDYRYRAGRENLNTA
jgi:hypothetical protein